MDGVEDGQVDRGREVPNRGSFAFRRVVIGMFLEAGRPMTVQEVVRALLGCGVSAVSNGRPLGRTVADLLGHQVRIGRAIRVARGTYAVVPAPFSPSTRRRYVRAWRELSRT